jgi:hypothetical protein
MSEQKNIIKLLKKTQVAENNLKEMKKKEILQ